MLSQSVYIQKLFFFLFASALLTTGCTKKAANATAKPVESPKTSVGASSPKAITGSDAEAITILKGYIDAMGGKEKMMSVKSMMTKSVANSPMGDITITQYVKNGKSAMKVEAGGTTVSEQIFDGTNIYVSAMGQKQTLTDPSMVKAAKKQAAIFSEIDQLINDKEIKKFGGLVELDGKKVNKITTIDEDKKETVQYFDPVSNLQVRTVSTVDALGQKVTQTMDFSDYKEVNGIKFPHSIKMSGGSVPFPMELKITALMINSDLPDALFKMN